MGVSSSLPLDADSGVIALAIDPATPTPSTPARGHGVFKSTDGGADLESHERRADRCLRSDPSYRPLDADTLYAAAGTGYSVFKSTDSAGAWNDTNFGALSVSPVSALAIDPLTPGTLYVGTDGYGVFKSTDAGTTWQAANTGLTSAGAVRALAVDPITPHTLYAGTDGGVYDSTWKPSRLSCASDPTTLCLSDGRFQVTTQWATAAGQSGSGQAVTLAGGDAGYFTFFDSGNVEVAVKVLNGCGSNGHFLDLRRGPDRRQRRRDGDRHPDRRREDLHEPARHRFSADPGHERVRDLRRGARRLGFDRTTARLRVRLSRQAFQSL